MNRLLPTLVLAITLVGCMTSQAVYAPAGLRSVSPEKSGIVFGSIGNGPDASFSAQYIKFRARGSDESGTFSYWRDVFRKTPQDFSQGGSSGSIFFVRLPPGEYEIFYIEFYINRGQFGSASFSPREKFSIPFRVKEGQAVYLGELLAHSTMGRNIFGMPLPAGGYFVVADKFERDLAILKTKEGVGAIESHEKAVIDTRSLGVPFFRSNAL